MEWYKVKVEKTKGGYYAESKEFDVGVNADTEEHAVSSLKKLIVEKGLLIMREGKTIPVPCNIDYESNAAYVYLEFDMQKAFRESLSESVRKNISLPAWMDLQLRNLGIDASKLFQEAAMKKIDECMKPAERVSTLEQFKSIADKDTLKKLIKDYLAEEVL